VTIQHQCQLPGRSYTERTYRCACGMEYLRHPIVDRWYVRWPKW
jgi:hypothetical protein